MKEMKFTLINGMLLFLDLFPAIDSATLDFFVAILGDKILDGVAITDSSESDEDDNSSSREGQYSGS